MQALIVTPTKSGNGFIAGERYTFQPVKNIPEPGSLYVAFPIGMQRIENAETLTGGQPSAHLWEGRGYWPDVAGCWEVIDSFESDGINTTL